MKKTFGLIAILFALSTASFAQKEKGEKGEKGEREGKEKITVPVVVKTALSLTTPIHFVLALS